jgi:hypothetical protein
MCFIGFCTTTNEGTTSYEAKEELGREERDLDMLLSIYDKNYEKVLKEFCHFYQIPFIENNLLKTTYDAAKIYYKLEENSDKIPDKFNWLAGHLSSIPKEEVEDLETKFNMQDKWMKFFVAGMGGPEISVEKAIKNKYSGILFEYVKDKHQKFTVRQMIRAYDVMEDNYQSLNLSDELLLNLTRSMVKGNFNFYDQQLIINFCHAVHNKSHIYGLQEDFKDLKDHYSKTSFFYSGEPILKTPILSPVKLEKILSNAMIMMVPYIKLHGITDPIVLNLLRKFNLLDAELFTSFMDEISVEYFFNFAKNRFVQTHDPYSNNIKQIYAELWNLLNHGLKQSPDLLNSDQSKKFIPAFMKDYLQFLRDKNFLLFPEKSEENIGLDMGGLVTDIKERKEYNDKLLMLIDEGAEGIVMSTLKPEP